jgi:hypothetical protein
LLKNNKDAYGVYLIKQNRCYIGSAASRILLRCFFEVVYYFSIAKKTACGASLRYTPGLRRLLPPLRLRLCSALATQASSIARWLGLILKLKVCSKVPLRSSALRLIVLTVAEKRF